MASLVAAFTPAPHQVSPATAPDGEKGHGRRPPKAKSAKATVCLDYLKGKCTREQCRYPHPDLTLFQRLSDTAGEQVCEVWAATGLCKFGAKCNRLHPVFEPTPSDPVGAALPAPALASPAGPTPPADPQAEFETFAQSLLKSVDEAGWQSDGERLPVGKDLSEKPLGPPTFLATRAFPAVLRFDTIFLDILNDLHLVAC
eukprot:EG_transcript_12097